MAGGYAPEFRASNLFGGIENVRRHIRSSIQKVRLRRALTSTELADQANLPHEAIERYFAGEDIPFHEISQMIWALGLAIDEVLPPLTHAKDVERARVERHLSDELPGAFIASSGSAPIKNPQLDMDSRIKLQLIAELAQDSNPPWGVYAS